LKKIAGRLSLALIVAFVATSVAYAQRRPSDEALKARVQAALVNASDVPGRDITVDVKAGVVNLTGRVPSDGMRGSAYPGAFLQQSVGAIVRAIPGVKDVRFSVQIEPLRPAAPPAPQGRGVSPGAR
jgi:osmotically-inducible protein OsmY